MGYPDYSNSKVMKNHLKNLIKEGKGELTVRKKVTVCKLENGVEIIPPKDVLSLLEEEGIKIAEQVMEEAPAEPEQAPVEESAEEPAEEAVPEVEEAQEEVEEAEEAEPAEAEAAEEEGFSCPECNRVLKSKAGLSRHASSHK